jgi:hypothetical protein
LLWCIASRFWLGLILDCFFKLKLKMLWGCVSKRQ